MASGRTYTVTSALVTLASTSQTAIICGTTGATVTADVQALRIGIYSGGGVSYPSNGTVQCSLYRPTGTAAGGTAATPRPHNASDIAANSTWLDASGGAITGLTLGAVVTWNQVLPFTAGATWADWVTPGAEWRIGASTNLALYLTCSSAGTATQFQAEFVFAE